MHDFWHIDGHDVVRDPGLLRLRSYLPVLAAISAPYSGAGGTYDPVNPLNPAEEWQALVAALGRVPELQQARRVPLALARLVPPTLKQLGAVLSVDGRDAFRVLHLVAHGDHDTLVLEDERGLEQLAGAEVFVRLFEHTGVRLVVLDGGFSPAIADLLVERTPVQAVIGTRRRLPEASAEVFNAQLYAALGDGQPVGAAFRAAVGALEQSGGGADRYELVAADGADRALPLPAQDLRGDHALLLDGQPHRIAVPEPLPLAMDFVDRRDELAALADMLPSANTVITLHGPAGIGKTWLAAQAIERFGWHFPDGVVYLRCDAMTTDQTVLAQIACVLAERECIPAGGSMRGDVLDALEDRRVLVVLDDLDVVQSDNDRVRIVHAMDALCAQTGSCVIVTLRRFVESLAALTKATRLEVTRFDHKAARTLAMQLAVARDLDELDVDTIDDFLDRAQGVPWLIAAGVDWVETHGYEAALAALAVFPSDAADPLAAYAARQVRVLIDQGDDALRLLRRAGGLPDAFDRRLALGLGGDNAVDQIATLDARGLLVSVGDLLMLPPLVRAEVRAQLALDPAQQAQVDRVIMTYYTRTWPDATPARGALRRADWARVANVQALLLRALHGSRLSQAADVAVVAGLVAASASLLRAAGLVHVCDAMALALLHNDELKQPGMRSLAARVKTVFGACMGGQLDGYDTADETFKSVLAQQGLDPDVRAEAAATYGRVLVDQGDDARAVDSFSQAFQALRSQQNPNAAQLAALLHDWARALARGEQHAEALQRYREALAAYARADHPIHAAEALHELGVLLAGQAGDSLETLERAEDLLRRAEATAQPAGKRRLLARVRRDLAALYMRRADAVAEDEAQAELTAAAAGLLAARHDGLIGGAGAHVLADVLYESARVDARRGVLADAGDDALRSVTYYARAGDAVMRVAALVLAGRLLMARGDSVAAQSLLHEALDRASQHHDTAPRAYGDLLAEASGVLVRVHQIRARHALRGNNDLVAYAREQAYDSRVLLDRLDLQSYADALDRVIAGLA